MQITITHTISPELLSALEGILKAANGGSQVQPAAKHAKRETVKEIAPAATTSDETETSQAEVSIVQVRELVQAKAKEGKKAGIESLLAEFGAKTVPTLDPKKYPEFLTKLQAL